LVTQDAPNIFKSYTAQETLYSFLPVIATGGSTTIPDAWNNMRYAGATAREMLVQAGAKRWNVSPNDCYAEDGQVVNKKNNERLKYGDLAEEAGSIELKSLPKLKDKKDYKVIGKSAQRIDIPEKVNGEAIFGLDVRMDGLVYAAVKHPKTIGGKITGIKNEEAVMKMKGVKKVFLSDYGVAMASSCSSYPNRRRQRKC